ncbi:MAG: hypothetical protein QM737_21845 [Ferruginibacter sp.]
MIKVIFFIWTAFISDKELNCSCFPISVEDDVKKSHIIFTGKILKLDTLRITDEYIPKGAFRIHYLATIQASRVFKGNNLQDTVYIITGNGEADCGFPFERNKDYLVYANEQTYTIIDSLEVIGSKFRSRKMKYFTTSICDRTTMAIKEEEKLLVSYLSKTKL